MRSKSIALALATAAVGGVLAAATVGAPSAATSWTPVTGSNDAGDQLALARTDDGTLHVIWNSGSKPPGAIVDARFSASGAKLGTTTLAGRWNGIHQGVALLVMPDKTLRLFVTGSPMNAAGGMNMFTASANGTGWALQPEHWGNAITGAASVIGAALTKDGQVVTGWSGVAAVGMPPASIPDKAYASFQTATHLATDAGSGAVVLAGVYGGGKTGIWVQQVAPRPGKAVVLPDGDFVADQIEGLSGRVGAPGVYVAYVDRKAAHLYRYGGGSRTLAKGPFTSATACPGPEGRLWLAWGDSNNGLFVTRTNRAAGTLETIQKLTLPPQSPNGLKVMECEGSAGPLDLFAQVVDKANRLGFSHTHVLAMLTLTAHAAKRKVTVTARDAADPVAGVSVRVGGKHLKTDVHGQATLTLSPGSYPVTGTAPGYMPATARVTVR